MNHYSSRGSTHFAHLLPLLNELSRQGVQVRLLIEKAEEEPEGLEGDVEFVIMPGSRSRIMRTIRLFREVRSATTAGYRTIFVRIASWSALAAIAASAGGRGRVFFWQSGTTIGFDRSQPFGIAKLKWYLASRLPNVLVWRFCHRLVTGPEPMVTYYVETAGVPAKKVALLYNDIDLPRFQIDPGERARERHLLRQRLGLDPATIVLLFVHRMSPVRRTLEYLPDALLRLRSSGMLDGTCLVVAGGGSEAPALQSACHDAGLDDYVRFVGETANRGIESLYAAVDVFIQPSHAEGFPRVLLEAMASGLPIVTTGAGGSGWILGALQQKYVTDPDHFQDFGLALEMALRERASWPELIEENLRMVQRFDTPVVAQMYRQVLFS